MRARPHRDEVHESPAAFPLHRGAEGTVVRPERRGVQQLVDERHHSHAVLVPLDGVGLEVARAVDAYEAGQLEVDVLEAQARPVEHQGAVGLLAGHNRHWVLEALVHDVLEQALLAQPPLLGEDVVGRVGAGAHGVPSLEEPAEQPAALRIVGPLEVLLLHLGHELVRTTAPLFRTVLPLRQDVGGLHHARGGWRGSCSNERAMWRESASIDDIVDIDDFKAKRRILTRNVAFGRSLLTRTGQCLPVPIFLGPFFNQLRPSVAFEALGPSQFAARAAAIGWAQPAGGMAGDTQPGAVVVHELNAMGYTQLALESQAKASLVQGCACT